MVFKAKETSPGFMTAAFREDATPEDIFRAIIPHLDTLGRGQFMRRECEECHRVGIGLSLIVGALKDWEKRNPAFSKISIEGPRRPYQRETKDHEEKTTDR